MKKKIISADVKPDTKKERKEQVAVLNLDKKKYLQNLKYLM